MAQQEDRNKKIFTEDEAAKLAPLSTSLVLENFKRIFKETGDFPRRRRTWK